MAIKGLSIPVCGTYKKEEDRVSYEEPFVADHAVEYGVSWEMGDDAPLYGDNKTIENARGTFKSGELTLGTADLPQELSMKILGLKVKETEFGPEGEKIQVKELTYDDDMKAPYLGFGIMWTSTGQFSCRRYASICRRRQRPPAGRAWSGRRRASQLRSSGPTPWMRRTSIPGCRTPGSRRSRRPWST